jgi:hypothetical protein
LQVVEDGGGDAGELVELLGGEAVDEQALYLLGVADPWLGIFKIEWFKNSRVDINLKAGPGRRTHAHRAANRRPAPRRGSSARTCCPGCARFSTRPDPSARALRRQHSPPDERKSQRGDS